MECFLLYFRNRYCFPLECIKFLFLNSFCLYWKCLLLLHCILNYVTVDFSNYMFLFLFVMFFALSLWCIFCHIHIFVMYLVITYPGTYLEQLYICRLHFHRFVFVSFGFITVLKLLNRGVLSQPSSWMS